MTDIDRAELAAALRSWVEFVTRLDPSRIKGKAFGTLLRAVDSLELTEFVTAFWEEFGIQLSESDFQGIETFDDLVELAYRRMKGRQ
jgi:acyl carrier protein